MSWIDDEPGLHAVGQEVRRLVGRARRRPALVVLVALLGAAVPSARRAMRPASYEGQIVFRLAEGDLAETGTTARPPREIRAYLSRVALSNGRLLAIMEKHELSKGLRKINTAAALESFREDLAIDVSRNYFAEDRGQGPPRWARVVLRYEAGSPSVAAAVVRDLGQAVIDQQAAERQRAAHAVLAEASAAAGFLQEELARRSNELTRRVYALEGARGPEEARLRVEIASLRGQVAHLTRRAQDAEKRLMSLRLAADVEEAGAGLRFEPVEEATLLTRRPVGRAQLVVEGIVLFFLLVPVAMTFVGAFDRRVYDAEDVRRLGLQAAAVVPRFPGDELRPLRIRVVR